MNHRIILIGLLILTAITIPGSTAFAGQAPPSKWSDCSIAVLPGQRDDVGRVLAGMNLRYSSITNADVKDDAFLDKQCVLFIASGSAAGRDAAPHIARWVERGGSLYVSGSALDVLLDAFPGRVAPGTRALAGPMRVELTDTGAAMAFGKEITLQVPGEGWTLVGKTDGSVHARGYTSSGDAPIVVSFDAGQGRVVYNVLNTGADVPDAQQKLVRFLVIRTLFARDAAQALRRFPSASLAPIQIADTIDPDKFSVEYAYTAREADDLDVALVWGDGRLGVTLRRPDATEITQQGDASPLVVPIRNAAPGAWKVFARGLDVPSANSPFLLMVIPRQGTNLLNSVPTPLQISTDTSMLTGSLVLALVIASLFALSGSLFVDALAGRQSNRLWAALIGATSKVGGAFGSLFAPTTWKVPPLVRRLAVALELAVFLALTALVASFLDPYLAPTSARGVGIFVCMLVALAVGTFAFALTQSAVSRACGVTGAFQIRPGYLIVVAVCVLVSRLIGFAPGYLFGLPAGLAVLGAVEGARRRDGMLAFVALLAPLAVGLVFWGLTIPTDLALRSMAQSQVDAAVSGGMTAVIGAVQTAFLFVFLVAVWQTFFELFPVAGLNGWTLFTRARLVWFVLLVAAAFLVLHTLVNPTAMAPEATENRALLLIIVALGVYSAAAVGTWLLFNGGRLRGEGAALPRGTLITLALTILVWLCVCGLGAAMAVLRSLGPK